MKRIISYVIIFVLGFVVCALVLRGLYGPPVRGSNMVATTNTSSEGTPAIARKGDDTVAVAAAKAEKFVVNIDTVGRPVSSGPIGLPDFFGLGPPQEFIPKGQASGVIINPNGYVLTNNHVVADTSKVTVTLWNKKRYEARIAGRDPRTDLAVIKIDASGLPYAVFADSSKLKVGQWVIAVGNALGLGTTVTVGVVSATDRGSLNIEGTILENAIQTDTAINRGNSGGALTNINGDLVGINTAIASTSPGGGSIGVGFAIPSNTAKGVADEIIEHGKVIRPWLGISYAFLDDAVRAQLKARKESVPPMNGGRVEEVMQGSPADAAGLAPHDVIIKINGKEVTNARTISDEMKKVKVGGIVELTVWHVRNGQVGRIAVKTREMPTSL